VERYGSSYPESGVCCRDLVESYTGVPHLPLSLSSFRRAVAVTATCALAAGALAVGAAPASALVDTDNDVSVVGYGDQNASYISQLPVAVDGFAVLDVAVGNQESFVLRNDNTVYATWSQIPGAREVTNLTNQFGGRVVTDLEASYTGTFALLDDGALVDDPSQSGGASQGFAAATEDQQFSQISAGRHFAVAVTTGGVLRSWGSSPVGGDNTADVDLVAAGYNHAVAYTNDRQVLVLGSGGGATVEDAGEAAIGEHEVVELTAGINSNFALLDDGTVVSFGANAAAFTSAVATALGTHKAVGIEARYAELYVTVDDGRVLSFQQNPNGSQTINADVAALADGHRVLQVVGGEFQTLLVLEEPEVSFSAGEAPLDRVVLATSDTVTLTADGFLGGAEYSILWDDVSQTVGTVPSTGVLSQTIEIPDTLTKGIHEVSLVVAGEAFDADVTIGAGFTAAVPTISGTTKVGEELTASAGKWSLGASLSYSWLRDGKKISGATGSTYVLTASDLGKAIQVAVKGTKGGTSLTKTSVKTAKIGKGALYAGYAELEGTLVVGNTLSVAREAWDERTSAFSYQWYANGIAISKATKSTFPVSAAMVDKRISVRVTGSAAGYTSVVAWAYANDFIQREYLDLDIYYVAGTASIGKTLTLKRTMIDDQTPGTTLTYQWQRNGQPIGGASKATYKVTAADAGNYITASVFGAKAGYYPSYSYAFGTYAYAEAAKAGTVKITGTAKVGKTLTVTITGQSENVCLYYTWTKTKGSVTEYLSNEASTYTISAEDKGYTISVEAYFSEPGKAQHVVYAKSTKTVVA